MGPEVGEVLLALRLSATCVRSTPNASEGCSVAEERASACLISCRLSSTVGLKSILANPAVWTPGSAKLFGRRQRARRPECANARLRQYQAGRGKLPIFFSVLL
ncbi:hypothetical protein ANCCAN_10170 [Ancylostoma caninum]|uniref:Uncharacterized protein n=1 Tax=Ancylostoma caninum TaxID=29170 RepID=A0A368GHL8_ANCCA|nr:hypothetical protein ANCCAN_10170 [Ancylostoma caninum]